MAWQGVKRPAFTWHKQTLCQGRLQAGVKPSVPRGKRLLSGCEVESPGPAACFAGGRAWKATHCHHKMSKILPSDNYLQ